MANKDRANEESLGDKKLGGGESPGYSFHAQ